MIKLRKIFVLKSARRYPLARKILKRLPKVPVQVINREDELADIIQAQPDPAGFGKRHLVLKPMKGHFVKPCPCTPCYLGCKYYVIHADLNCPLDCTYCILQLYLNQPWLTVHVNTEDMWRQLDAFLKLNNRFLRIGTGELGDSLALDPLTGRSKEFIEYFRKRPQALFELKTKTVNIENILQTPPADNIIIAWSLNSFHAGAAEEKGAPGVSARIQAAEEVVRRGYRVAFHFDPLLLYSGWEEGYKEIIDLLLTRIETRSIAWISLGSLRFPPDLKPVIQQRFPESGIVYQEMIKGMDGKLRYFKPQRMKLYRTIVSYFGKKGDCIPIYFCMESDEVWRKVLRKKMGSEVEIEQFLTSLPR